MKLLWLMITILQCKNTRTEEVKNVRLTCNFKFKNQNHFGIRMYHCILNESIIAKHQENVNEITGIHEISESNSNVLMMTSDVEFLTMDYYNSGTLPTGFANFFPNLLGIQAIHIGLKQLMIEDLSPFKHLKYLNFQDNKLTILQGSLFKLNPVLEFINLRSNKFNYISPKIFDGLEKLTFVDLEGCNIISMRTNETSQVVNVKNKLQEIQSQYFEELKKDEDNLTTFLLFAIIDAYIKLNEWIIVIFFITLYLMIDISMTFGLLVSHYLRI